MNRTITAMFDSQADADRAMDALRTLGAGNRRMHAATPGGGEDHGILAAITGLFIPDDDRAAYDEGLRRGSVLVSAEVEESGVDAAMDAMEAAGAIDLDTRAEEWRGSGWVGGTPGLAAGTGLTGSRDGAARPHGRDLKAPAPRR